MNARRNSAVAVWLGVLSMAAAAQDPEVTMRLVPDPTADPRAVLTQPIRLPDSAAERAIERSADGLETANANRAAALERARANRAPGLAIAAEVRERGAEIAEAANGKREDVTRGRPSRDEPPGPPSGRPAVGPP